MSRRVLHLIDGPPDADATPATLALLSSARGAAADADDAVLLVGGVGLNASARAAGLHGYQRVGAPFASALWGYPAVRRAVRRMGPIDLVHAWSPGAARFAHRAMPRTPAVLSLTRPLHCGEAARVAAWHRARLASASRIVLHDPTWRRPLSDAGLPDDAVTVVHPAFDPALLSPDRTAVRDAWGVVDGDALVVVMLDPSPLAADAARAALGVGLAAIGMAQGGDGRRCHLVMHPCQWRRGVAARVIDGFGAPGLVRQDARVASPWTVLAGCDAALVLGGGGPLLPWAMAAGVPLLADPLGLAAEVLRDEEHALFTPGPDHRSIAHQFTRLANDPALARRLADRAWADVPTHFDRETYRQRIAGLYAELG